MLVVVDGVCCAWVMRVVCRLLVLCAVGCCGLLCVVCGLLCDVCSSLGSFVIWCLLVVVCVLFDVCCWSLFGVCCLSLFGFVV